MIFTDHVTANHTFGAPPGTEALVGDLRVRIEQTELGNAFTSFWKPSAAELKALNEGHFVTLSIYGHQHPVVSMGVEP